MPTYKDAGVDVEAGYKAVKLMQEHVKKTMRPEVLSEIGGFGGMFAPNMKDIKEPVFVSGTDGVGSKLKIAFMLDKHDTVGIDCVAMCVNDIICSGAEPLFFLDYIALDKNIPETVAKIVSGVANGCVQAGCALIGGETAEMPGFYSSGEYDIAGFAVGMVDKSKIIDGKSIKEGDVLIGLASSGLHSNGYSLVRKILNIHKLKGKLNEHVVSLGTTIGEELIRPTKIYVSLIRDLISKFEVKGISNITGGGFIENIPRMIPDGLKAKILKDTWPILPIFKLLKNIGDLEDECLFNTFNMGIGMVFAVSAENSEQIITYINRENTEAYIIGEIINGASGVEIC